HADPAYRICLEPNLESLVGALFPERRKGPPLDDAELSLTRVGHLDVYGRTGAQSEHARSGATGPTQRALHGVSGRLDGGGVRVALVENHRDVGAELRLDVRDFLGRQEMSRSVEVTSEFDALLSNRSSRCEAEDLVPSAVGQDRFWPSNEPMQAALPGDEVVAWPQVQVVGVAQQDLCTERFQIAVSDAFDRPLGADRHERRRVDLTVRGRHDAAARARIGASDLKVKRGAHLSEFTIAGMNGLARPEARPAAFARPRTTR